LIQISDSPSRPIGADDNGDLPPSVPMGTHIWHLPSITKLKMSACFTIPPLFRAPKLLECEGQLCMSLLHLKELMLYSPLLQKVDFGAFTERFVFYGDQERSREKWKEAQLEWLDDLIVSRSVTTTESKRCSFTSIWPSLTHYRASVDETPLSILQITILPIVNQLRQVNVLSSFVATIIIAY
jgi:hypothetical protein